MVTFKILFIIFFSFFNWIKKSSINFQLMTFRSFSFFFVCLFNIIINEFVKEWSKIINKRFLFNLFFSKSHRSSIWYTIFVIRKFTNFSQLFYKIYFEKPSSLSYKSIYMFLCLVAISFHNFLIFLILFVFITLFSAKDEQFYAGRYISEIYFHSLPRFALILSSNFSAFTVF